MRIVKGHRGAIASKNPRLAENSKPNRIEKWELSDTYDL